MKLDFSKGIYTNTKAINIPKGYYSDAENMRSSGESKRAEEGTLVMPVPVGLKQWGNCAIGDETIILGELGGQSIIGSLNNNDEWTTLINRQGTNILGIVGKTQVEGRKDWAGNRIIYFTTPSGARRIDLDGTISTNDTEFDKTTSLFLEFDLPITSYIGEKTTGELNSGVYQIGARLVTDSGAATSFGIVTNPIPITTSSSQSTRQDTVGNEPQTKTSKTIEVSISNIDTSFKFVQLGVLTYVGSSNTPKLTVTNLISINDQSSLTYNYRGASDDLESLTVGEFIASGVSYTTGKYLAQKDGTLLIAAPEEQELPDIDWNRVAQGITAKYVIKEIPYQESLSFDAKDLTDVDAYSLVETSTNPSDQGYGNPLTCELYKGYRRDEVYSFTLTPVFVSGVKGPTVHIPADHAVNTAASGGNMGTYISEAKYPDSRYTGLEGLGLRLHKFPTAKEEPIISGNVTTSDCKLRVLGVEFSNIVLDASEAGYSDQIAGFIIGRVNRVGNETQLAQGIVRPHTDVQYHDEIDYARSSYLGDGFVSWFTDIRDGSGYYSNLPYGNPDLSDFNFVAPDLIHNLYSHEDASHIKQHSAYVADPYAAPVHTSIVVDDKFDSNRYGIPRVFFKNIEGVSAYNFTETADELDGLKTDVAPFGVPLAPEEEGGQIDTTLLKGGRPLNMASTDGFVWLNSANGSGINAYRDHKAYYESHQKNERDDSGKTKIYMKPLLALGTKVIFILHTLTRINNKQYGELDQQVSMFAHYQDWADGSTAEFFNGDTFISKYGLTVNDESAFTMSKTSESFDEVLYPPCASGIINMFIESSNNYNYRHYIEPAAYNETNVNVANGSTPFFPAYKQLMNQDTPFGLLTMKSAGWARPGYARQYNNQYSAQPTVQPYAITPLEDITVKASLVNRIAYSVQSVQGEKSDAYQIFLPNNYYDVPLQFGELTDVYVNQELFASTAQVQWKLFFNTLATQATSAGEVVLGTGGAFNRPAVPLQTVDGGYGGTSSWTHAVNTVFGRIIVDKRQGKVFLLREGMENISQDLDDLSRTDIQKLDDDQIVVGSEPLRERAFLRFGDDMLSFKLDEKLFISRHSYIPRWMFSHGSFMYSNITDPIKGDIGVHKHSQGPTGSYFGQVKESSITLIANEGNDQSKIFRNLNLVTAKKTEEGTNVFNSTFNKLQVLNDERNTGVLTIVPKTSAFQQPGILEVLANKVTDSFRIDIPRDVVINPNLSIFDTDNHAQKPGDQTAALWLPKMRGNFVEIKLTTDNLSGPMYLHSVNVGVSENKR